MFLFSSLCHKKMKMGVKINPASKRLYHGDNAWGKLSASNGLEVFQKGLFPAETESGEKRAFVFEEYSQHLGDGEDDLAVRDIEKKLLPHPLSPLFPPFGMTGRAESSCRKT